MSLWRNSRHKVWVDRGFDFVIEAVKIKPVEPKDKKK